MISLIYLASALILGTAVTRRLGLKLLVFEAPALAAALGLFLWTWLSFLLALLVPYYLSLALTVALAGGASLWLWYRSPTWSWRPLPGGRPGHLAWGLFSLTTAIVLGWLMWTHDLLVRGDSLYSANATWADFGLHASLASHFAAATQLSLDFPLAAGTRLTYPFLMDLLSGWLVYGGWSLQLALLVPGLLLALAFLQLILGFSVRLFGHIGGAIFGLSLSLLCGSAAGLVVAAQDFAASRQPLFIFLAHLPQDYTALTTPNAQLTNFLADAILPQRTFVMGLAMFGTVLILLLHLRHHPNLRLTLFTGLLIGLLPLVHAYTFFVLGALTVSCWLEATITTHRPLNRWLTLGATALLIAAPQLLWQSLANHTGTGGHLALGWIINPGESLLSFWTHNYGLTLLIIIALAIALFTRRTLHSYLVWYAPILVIFILANLYSLQPFTYDNHKLLLYVYLITYLLASYGALWLIQRRRWLIMPTILIAMLISASGTLAVIHEFEHQDQFASRDDISLANWVRAATLPTDAFFTTDSPNQPIASLGGRSLVAGYRGWLYNYNLDYQPRLDAIQQALLGRQTTTNPYHARYVAVRMTEPEDWTVDTAALLAHYHLIYANPTWTVYRLP